MLKQRKVTEEAKKEMQDIEAILGEDAKNNKQYQDAQKKYNKEQLKSQKLERKRSLFQRFKDTKEEKGTGAAVGQLGKTAGEGALKGLKGVFGFIKRFVLRSEIEPNSWAQTARLSAIIARFSP